MRADVEIQCAGLIRDDYSHGDWILQLVARDGGGRRAVQIHLPYEVYSCFAPGGVSLATPTMLRYALPGIESAFRDGALSCEGSDPIHLFISAENVDELRATAGDHKRCRWVEAGRSGPECRACGDEGPAMTTAFACRTCAVADDRLRCADFVHPVTQAVKGGAFGRNLVGVLCDSGERHPGPDCNPDLKLRSCWKRRVQVERVPAEPSADIGDRVVDEIDFFTVAFRLATGKRRPWPIPRARSAAALFGPCVDYKDFSLRAAAVADLLDKLVVPATNGNAGDGAVPRLVALVTEKYGSVVDDAERLRSIQKLRNLHPLHGQADETRVFADLGLRYPPDSWDLAWRQVLTLFHESLRNLRRAMQAAAGAER